MVSLALSDILSALVLGFRDSLSLELPRANTSLNWPMRPREHQGSCWGLEVHDGSEAERNPGYLSVHAEQGRSILWVSSS